MSDKPTPLFQTSQELCFDTILDLYGQDCTWEKDAGDEVAVVLFNDPTKEQRFQVTAGRGLSHVAYDNAPIIKPYIEFRKGQFVGLWEAVFEQQNNQYLATGEKRYVASQSESFFDGQTYRIALEEATDDEIIAEP